MRHYRSPLISPLPTLSTSMAPGLFRVMPEPDDWAIRRLRHSAEALGVDWPKTMSLEERERDLDPNDPKQAAFMLAIRRAGAHASYAPFHRGPATLAFGNACDLCPRNRAASTARRPVCLRSRARHCERPSGSRLASAAPSSACPTS